MFDLGQRCLIIKRSPFALFTPCKQLNRLKHEETEQGALNPIQQMQWAKCKVYEFFAVIRTGKTQVTAFDWALLSPVYLVLPLYSGNCLRWPDGDGVQIKTWRR